MATSKLTIQHSFSEFGAARAPGATPPTEFNFEIFSAEVDAAAFAARPSVRITPSNPPIVEATWTPEPNDVDQSLYESLVGTHVGGQISGAAFSALSNVAVDAPDATDVTVLSLTTSPLAKGPHLVSWSAEYQMVAAVNNAFARITMRFRGQNRAREFWPHDRQSFFGQSFVNNARAGEIMTLELQLSRAGGASGIARVLAGARLSVTPL